VRHIECPHCRKGTISLRTKLFLGPARTVTCAACGGKMSVPGSGIWVAIPLISAILAVLFAIESGILKVAVFAVGAALSGLLHYRCLPLVPR
jgi:ribosomal protein S27E